MQFRVHFYFDINGNKPIIAFLEDLRKQDRIVPKRMAFCDVVLMELTTPLFVKRWSKLGVITTGSLSVSFVFGAFCLLPAPTLLFTFFGRQLRQPREVEGQTGEE